MRPRLIAMTTVTTRAARRPRAYLRVKGPDAEEFLQRMVSNDVTQADVIDALLLTPKARLIAPLRVLRRGADDFLLLTEPELGEKVRTSLLRARLASKCEVEPEQHTSTLVWSDEEGFASAREELDIDVEPNVDALELERLRIEEGVPAWGSELDDSILPAEAGLDDTHISFTKGCFPGQEPVARLHYRGHANRGLRVLTWEGSELPPYDEPVAYDGKDVGRVTSVARDGERIIALAYVRVEVPPDAELQVGTVTARSLD